MFAKLLIAISFITYSQLCLSVEYLSPSEVNKPKNELSLIEQYPEKLIQGIFWYIHTEHTKNKITFSSTNDESYGNNFTPSETTEFMIMGVEDKVSIKNRKVFKVLFPDDKEGYIDVFYFNLYLAVNTDSDQAYYGDFISYKSPTDLEKAKIAKVKKEKSKVGVRIGMSKKQALNSTWGRPDDVNKTTTKSGTTEQWVYGNNKYLYFENGKLTAIEN